GVALVRFDRALEAHEADFGGVDFQEAHALAVGGEVAGVFFDALVGSAVEVLGDDRGDGRDAKVGLGVGRVVGAAEDLGVFLGRELDVVVGGGGGLVLK